MIFEILFYSALVALITGLVVDIYGHIKFTKILDRIERHIEEENRLKESFKKKLVEKDLVIDSFDQGYPKEHCEICPQKQLNYMRSENRYERLNEKYTGLRKEWQTQEGF